MEIARQLPVWVPFLILIAGMGFFPGRTRQLQRIADALDKRG